MCLLSLDRFETFLSLDSELEIPSVSHPLGDPDADLLVTGTVFALLLSKDSRRGSARFPFSFG